MSTARLTLVSHGMTSAVRAARFPGDEPLEDGARHAARSVAVVGRTWSPDRVLHDGTRRTVDTAAALGLTGSAVLALSDLDVGRWRGLSLDQVDPGELARWTADPAAATHGGESVEALLSRVAAWLTTIEPGRTVAVTHPAVVRAVVVQVLRADPSSFWRLNVPPMTATTLHGRSGQWTIRAVAAPLVAGGA